MNWEKISVYIAGLSIGLMFASKVNDLSERISKIEGKLQILLNERK